MAKEPTSFAVHLNSDHRRVQIVSHGTEPSAGFEEIGSFSVEPGDPLSINGEHIFIVGAKKFLVEQGFTDLNSFMIEDKASNAPHPEEPILSTTEVEQRNRNALQGNAPASEGDEPTPEGTKDAPIAVVDKEAPETKEVIETEAQAKKAEQKQEEKKEKQSSKK